MDTQAIRFGLIGHGLWGAYHGKAIAQNPDTRLAAVADRSQENLSAARAAHPDAAVFTDWRELLARPDIDAVDIVIPSHLHFEVAKAALEAGKHVLVEKPMVLSVEHASQLIELARQKGKLLALDHQMRVSALWGRVKQLINQGVVGIPQYALLELARFAYRQGSDGWRYDIKRVGNWILEEPIHFFDLARWYMEGFGDPVSVFSRANSRQPDHPELQDNFTTIVDFAHGGFAVIAHTLAAFEHHQTCKVAGTEGAIWAYWRGADDRTPRPTFGLKYSHGGRIKEVLVTEATGEIAELDVQIAGIVRAIREGAPPAATGEDGRWSVRLCLAAQQSVDEKRSVRLDDIR